MDLSRSHEADAATAASPVSGAGIGLSDTPGRVAYFNHDADVGIVGRGPTIEAAFVAAAEAVFAVMTDLAVVRPLQTIETTFEEPDPELALVTWLNTLLAEARSARLVLRSFALERDGASWRGVARGEPWRDDMDRGVEVKGATLTELAVRHEGGVWEARCVVDV
jgi:SHS2 domain-containing protein